MASHHAGFHFWNFLGVGAFVAEAVAGTTSARSTPAPELAARVAALEARVAELSAKLEQLAQQIRGA